LGEFYVRIHSLSGEADQANLRAVYHLTWGLEKLTRKLLEKPTESSASILHTARAALDVIEELCGRKAKWDPCNPPIRILVVDDDPIALRAMSNALQLGFGRPDTAQSGEAAIAATSEKEYDVIFLDVLMPGMDGFAACPKIRETNLNPTTPVLFVTSLADASAREKSERAGGNGFILKPVIPAEIALTALTWALRARLDKGEPKAAQPRPEPAVV
jgi:CheY-like chemotaxis protein